MQSNNSWEQRRNPCWAFKNPKISKERLHLPGPDFIDRIYAASDRNLRVLNNLHRMFFNGRLGGTGYLSILPVDQGIEHSAGASFAKNPDYFDAENIVKLAIEGGCNAVASTFGVLGSVARKYAHKIPFIVKINHNELLTYPNKFDQILFGTVRGSVRHGRGRRRRDHLFRLRPEPIARSSKSASAFAEAHELGMATVLWCYLRNTAFKKDKDYHVSADLTGQANHLGVTIQADIIKQKLPENNGGYQALNIGDSSYGKFDKRIYTELTSDHPIDLTRYQVANCYMGRAGLDQLRRRFRSQRLRGSRDHRGHQQARRRHGPDHRTQSLPAPHGGRHQAAERDSGRVPEQGNHGRVVRRSLFHFVTAPLSFRGWGFLFVTGQQSSCSLVSKFTSRVHFFLAPGVSLCNLS